MIRPLLSSLFPKTCFLRKEGAPWRVSNPGSELICSWENPDKGPGFPFRPFYVQLIVGHEPYFRKHFLGLSDVKHVRGQLDGFVQGTGHANRTFLDQRRCVQFAAENAEQLGFVGFFPEISSQ